MHPLHVPTPRLLRNVFYPARHKQVIHLANLMGFVSDQGDDHTVQVEEEHHKVKSELDERLLYPDTNVSTNGRKE